MVSRIPFQEVNFGMQIYTENNNAYSRFSRQTTENECKKNAEKNRWEFVFIAKIKI